MVLAVLGGFPGALILGWAFYIRPGGIEVTPEPAPECPPAYPGPTENPFVLGLDRPPDFSRGRIFPFRAQQHPLDKSIALLPFSISADPQNAYFADGILTSLARIRDLKVISRTSVMPYRGQTA